MCMCKFPIMSLSSKLEKKIEKIHFLVKTNINTNFDGTVSRIIIYYLYFLNTGAHI